VVLPKMTKEGLARLGAVAEVAQVDALDERAVDDYLHKVVQAAGRLDSTFNAVCLDALHRSPLVEMARQAFLETVIEATMTHFVTATTAARLMAQQHAGVILDITATAGRGDPLVGGFGAACAAIEGFCRQLAAEVGPDGSRVVCLRSAGSPDALGVDGAVHEHAARTRGGECPAHRGWNNLQDSRHAPRVRSRPRRQTPGVSCARA
jgi:NAD(P)-dependent dehydrogenase (short-subunit alcohol dehydrogenase family)